jgi:hypothetical protein
VQTGTFYSRQLKAAEDEQRIGDYPYDPRYPVYTASDLGTGTKFATWFFQIKDSRVFWIDYQTLVTGGIPEFAKDVKNKPYSYKDHFSPFDIGITDIGSGKTRIEAARAHGIYFRAIKKVKSVGDRIDAGYRTLPVSYFNQKLVVDGLKGLLNYRRTYDEARREFTNDECHDWASHPGSAFTYGCLAAQLLGTGTKVVDKDEDDLEEQQTSAYNDFDPML